LSILLSSIFLSLHMVFDPLKKIVDENINSILINWECAFNKCILQASGLSPKNFWTIRPNPFLVGFLGQQRKKYKWSTHYDSECVTHLWGTHCECNSIGAHHAVISTKGPVRPTRIIYPYLKGDVKVANEITMTHCACNELVELRALCLRTCHLYSECAWYSRWSDMPRDLTKRGLNYSEEHQLNFFSYSTCHAYLQISKQLN